MGGAYDLYATRVHGLALRVLADASLAEEVTQDVFLSAWSHRAQFDPARGSLLPWLLTTTRNRSIDVIRARRGVGPLESEGGREVRSPLDVEAAVLTNLDRQAVVEAVAALPALQRSAIEQAYFGGHRLREIADSAGVPIGTIKGRMRLGLQKLAADLTLRGAVTRSQR